MTNQVVTLNDPTSQGISALHAAALAYARLGIAVFPCVSNEAGLTLPLRERKKPACGHGEKDATTDTDQINKWWGENPDYNIGIPPGRSGLCVIDIDGEEGLKSWSRLPVAPKTKSVLTPNGGIHLYFKGSLPASVSKLAAKIDTRGETGYVLAPPSVVNNVPYTVQGGDVAVAELPGWIPERLAAFKREPVAAPEGLVFDLAHNVSRARDWLRRQAVPIDGAGSDDATLRLAAMLHDLGVSPATCCELLEAHTGFDPEWIAEKVEHAWRYAQNAPGCYAVSDGAALHRAALKYAADNPEPTPRPKFEGPLVWGASLRERKFAQPEWVWLNRLMAYEPNLYTGSPGVGKTTLAENLAVAVAAGVPLLGNATTSMHVLLMAAEDTYGPVVENLKAIRQAFGVGDAQLDGRIHLLSVKSDPYDGGHRLASISDDGEVFATPFMKEVVTPYLTAIGEPVLWIVDPLAEFVDFNRLNDTASRVLATTFLAGICRLNGHQVTALVNDHPSKASMADGSHVGGSQQLKAAFTFSATLRLPKKPTGVAGHKELVFEILKGRYAAETLTTLYRAGDCPAFFSGAAAPGALFEAKAKVYLHLLDGWDAGRGFRKDGRGSTDLFGPLEVAQDLDLSEETVKTAMQKLLADKWLRWEDSAGGGKQGRTPAHFEIGPKAPDRREFDAL